MTKIIIELWVDSCRMDYFLFPLKFYEKFNFYSIYSKILSKIFVISRKKDEDSRDLDLTSSSKQDNFSTISLCVDHFTYYLNHPIITIHNNHPPFKFARTPHKSSKKEEKQSFFLINKDHFWRVLKSRIIILVRKRT